MNRIKLSVAALGATVVACAAAIGPTGASATAEDRQALAVATARAMAAEAGEPNPQVEVVAADRGQALDLLSGDGTYAGPSQTVYVVQMRGAFTGNMAHMRRGQAVPRSGVMYVLVDERTGELTDWGLPPQASDIHSIGRGR